MGTNTLKSNNIQFPIYNEDGTPFEGLMLRKATYDSVVMSLGDKITGEVVYKDNTLAVTIHEYIEFKNDPDDEDEDPVRFSLVNPPTIIREGLVKDNSDLKGMTKYSFEFYHPMYQLSNMPFSDVAVSSDERKYLSENKTFGWIGKPKDYIDKLNKNLQGTEWAVVMSSRFPRDKADTLSEVLSFDNNTIADALKTAYDTWEVPYIVDTVRPNEYSYIDEHNVQRDYYDDGKRFVVVFGLPSNEIYASEADRQTGNKFVFKMGQGVGLKNNSRNPRNNKIITRIAGSGSENNIPYGYPQIVWYGNQNWDYTINNNPSDPHSYPIYKGIVGGRYVKLIKHPFTRKNLMPSVYSRSVFNKVSPYNPWSGNVPAYNQTLWQLKQRIQSQYSQESTAVEIDAYETLLEKLDVAAAKTSGSVDFSGTQFEGSIYNNGEGLLNGYLQINEDPIIEFEFESVLIESKFETNNPSYDPDATLIDYYDAVASQEYPYQNEINPLAPSYEFHKFEDIKPEMDDGQSNVKILGATPLNNDLTPADSWDDTIDNDGKFVQSYFSVDLPVLSFDIYACAAITQEMQINMRGGACIGCTFTIQVDWDDYKKNFYDAKGNFDPNIGEGHPRDAEKYPDSSTEAITVICQKETQTFGTLMPNRYKYPQTNDEFVVLGISLPIEYIENAEARLDGEMKSYMLENNVYYYDYPLKFDEYFLVNHKNILRQLKPNTIVRFEFAKEELQLFVKQLSIKYGESPLPQYNITLTDNIEVVLNQIGQVAEDVERLGSLISIMRQNYGNNVYAQIASKLSKRDDDTAAGLITFLKGVLFGNSGLWGIDGQGIAHLNELYVDKLEATAAHFFELIIDRVKSVGGQIIVTAANAEITRVVEVYNSEDEPELIGWKCYWPNTDGDKTIYNEFEAGDQVVCASFNQARKGHSQDVSNKYYWRLCTDVGVEGNEHFIYLDATKGIASQYNGVPEVGDNIVQLGYNKEWSDAHPSEAASDKEQRKNAIIISAYNHNFLDAGIQAPSFVQYTGIDAFSLSAANRLNVISPSGNSFKGTFTVNSGENIEDILIRTIYKESSSRPSTPTYSEGSIPAGWSTTPPANATYQIWASVLQKNENAYEWGTPVKWNGMDGADGHDGTDGHDGNDGIDSIVYKLTPQQESALVDKNKTLTLTLTYNLWKYIGDSATQISFSGFTVIYKEGSDGTEKSLSLKDSNTVAYVNATKQNYTNSPLFYTVILRYNNVEVDRRIVPVTTSAKVVFEVGEDSIRSAVTQVSNIKNYFGFNRGILNSKVSGSEVCQLYPYGYGMACWGSLNRVYNLGLGTEDNNSTWTLYFEARADSNLNINVNFCDIIPSTINGVTTQDGQITLNTSWQVFRCVWSSPMNYVTKGGLNGFIDFEQSGTAQFYIRKICLVKGVKPMLEFVKADEDLTYSGGLQNFQWNIGATRDDSEKFMGMNVYKNPSTLNNSTVSFFDFFTKTIDIKNKTPYTLSFWAKANVDNVVVLSHLYETSWNLWKGFSTLENMRTSDGGCRTTLSKEWKHYTVHWYPNVEAITGTDASKKLVKNIIGCRLQKMDSPYGNNNAIIYLAGVTYQEGWVEDGQSTVAFQTSEIKQTADGIDARVSKVETTVGDNNSGLVKSVAALSVTSERIASTVDNMKVGGRNLILNGAFNYDSRYWSDWGSPTKREIVSIGGRKWMHIITTADSYQGYMQNRFDKGIIIRPNTKYTVSFLAYRANNSSISDWNISVGIHWLENGTGTAISQNWYHQFLLETTPKLYSYTFTSSDDSRVNSFNLMIGQGSSHRASGREFYITNIQLEEGTMATDWRESIEENHSLIEQTADNIKLEVEGELGECGIDITQNKITLNGDTDVNGMLTLNDDTQGFKVTGNGGNTYITPKTIGAESAWSNRAAIDITCTRRVSEVIVEDTQYYQGVFTSTNSFGYAKSGSQLILKNHSLSFQQKGYSPITPVTSGTTKTYTKYYIYIGSSTTPTEVTVNGTTASSITTFTISSGGNVKVIQEVHGVFRKQDIHTSSSQSSLASIPEMVCTQSYVATMPTGTVESVIGYDGLGVNFGNGKYVYIGQESAVFKFGYNGLKVTADGLRKWNGSAWVGLNTLNVVTVSSGTTLTGNEDFVLYNGSSGQRITLPLASSYKGKVIYFKSIASSNVEIHGIIRKQTSNQAYEQSVEIGKEAHFVISDGGAWDWFWCA